MQLQVKLEETAQITFLKGEKMEAGYRLTY